MKFWPILVRALLPVKWLGRLTLVIEMTDLGKVGLEIEFGFVVLFSGVSELFVSWLRF